MRTAPPLRRPTLLCALLLVVTACASREPYDYGPLVSHMPGSILVLPPLDETPEVEAAEGWLATATRPLVERGYYVFPVAVVHRMMRENGLPTPHEMHQVSLTKLAEIFDPDAVLYVTVREWGTSYEVLASNTRVSVEARLVDTATGTEIWRGTAVAVKSSNDGNQGGLIGAMVGAVVNQVVTSAIDPTPDVARQCNANLFLNSWDGLLPGPLHPDHAEAMAEHGVVLP